jgi:hypothetical protein
LAPVKDAFFRLEMTSSASLEIVKPPSSKSNPNRLRKQQLKCPSGDNSQRERKLPLGQVQSQEESARLQKSFSTPIVRFLPFLQSNVRNISETRLRVNLKGIPTRGAMCAGLHFLLGIERAIRSL